jgi:lycopene beta-cyclase
MILEVDYALVGGGLQNGLIALALCAAQPAARIAVIERAAALGGNHTWCFHAGDLSAEAARWAAPLIVHRWPGYDVAFPGRRRHLETEYACITSERLDQVVTAALRTGGHALWLGHRAIELEAHRVIVHDGDGGVHEVRAAAVIDARGPERGEGADVGTGYQKFVGLEVRCDAPHGLAAPILMDALCEQEDGFRFFYVLPLDAHRLLVEDTRFSDTAFLDVAELRQRVREYCAARGWEIAEVLREENGVLPLPWTAAPASFAPPAAPLRAGYGGGWFHPVTGYSFPVALRVAEAIAATPPAALPGPQLEELWRSHRRQLGFAFRLNAMMFRWFAPAQRYHVLEHFYRLPEPTIRRFYALALTAADKARVFVGRPPRGMSWRAALGSLTSPAAKDPR